MPDYSTWYTTGYRPTLAPGYSPQKGDAANLANTYAKRPDFNDATKLAKEGQEGSLARDPDGKAYLALPCARCGEQGALGEMQLGHIENWRPFAEGHGALYPGAVRAAFNDLTNLRWEHAACNVSHIFETLPPDQIEAFIAGGLEAMDARAGQVLWDKVTSSSAFSTDDDILAAQVSSAAEFFLTLSERHVPSEADIDALNVQPQITLADGRTLDIFTPLPIAGDPASGDAVKIADMKRPKWKPETYTALYTRWSAEGMVNYPHNAPQIYRCGSCGNWGEGHAMHVGHVTDWRTHIAASVGWQDEDGTWWADKGLALLAYADLKNLKFEHQSCNTSQCWEEVFGTPLNDVDDAEALKELKDFLDVADPGGTAAVHGPLNMQQELKLVQDRWVENYEATQALVEEIRTALDNLTLADAAQDVQDRAKTVFERYFAAALDVFGTAEPYLARAEYEMSENDNAAFQEYLRLAQECEQMLRLRVFDIEGLRTRMFGEFDGDGTYTAPGGREESNRAILDGAAQIFAVRYARFPAEVFNRAEREEAACAEILGT